VYESGAQTIQPFRLLPISTTTKNIRQRGGISAVVKGSWHLIDSKVSVRTRLIYTNRRVLCVHAKAVCISLILVPSEKNFFFLISLGGNFKSFCVIANKKMQKTYPDAVKLGLIERHRRRLIRD
jgi:hypothetical protein